MTVFRAETGKTDFRVPERVKSAKIRKVAAVREYKFPAFRQEDRVVGLLGLPLGVSQGVIAMYGPSAEVCPRLGR